MGGSQRIRKPNRDWNVQIAQITYIPVAGRSALENPIGIETHHERLRHRCKSGRSALENPIGIETMQPLEGRLPRCRRSALENPIGIETTKSPLLRFSQSLSQRIRKPNRDWNCYSGKRNCIRGSGRSALENPIGIETVKCKHHQRLSVVSQRIRKPNRDWNNATWGIKMNARSVAAH